MPHIEGAKSDLRERVGFRRRSGTCSGISVTSGNAAPLGAPALRARLLDRGRAREGANDQQQFDAAPLMAGSFSAAGVQQVLSVAFSNCGESALTV